MCPRSSTSRVGASAPLSRPHRALADVPLCSDPHLTHHVIFSLEVLPNWTAIAVQRYGEADGPLSFDLELTDEELDWCVAYFWLVPTRWLTSWAGTGLTRA